MIEVARIMEGEDMAVDTRHEDNVEVLAVTVERVTDGLGFGDGTISTEWLSDNEGKLDDGREISAVVDATVAGKPLVPVGHDSSGKEVRDDGCGDGRGVDDAEGAVFSKDDKTFERSIARPKVFGGGSTMATAAKIGVGEAKSTLRATFDTAAATLVEHDVDFGGHTDTHAHGPNCGCGAIDKAPEIIQAAVKYQSEISKVVQLLVGDEVPELTVSGADSAREPGVVMQRFMKVAGDEAFTEGYRGKDVMNDVIIDNAKIVKRLAGSHKEVRIVLNTVRGYTVNQGGVREATDDKAQVFGVDVWRMQDIAEKMYPDDLTAQREAFIGELVYTLAAAAVLTKGDLPVDIIRPQKADAED